jgi:hypothetical protein
MQVIHSDYALGIPKIDDWYHLCHTLEVINVQMVADKRVNAAVDSELARESAAKKNKTATTLRAQSIFEKALRAVSQSLGPSSPPLFPGASSPLSPGTSAAPAVTVKAIKAKAKTILREEKNLGDKSLTDNLPYQEGLLFSLSAQKLDHGWGAHISSLKKGTLKFLLNSAINCLPTHNNLKLWGLSISDRCKLCH